MRLWIASLSIFFLVIAVQASGERWIGLGTSIPQPVSVTVQRGAAKEWQVQVACPGIEVHTDMRSGTAWDVISLPLDEDAPLSESDSPLPSVHQWLGLQLDGAPTLSIATEEWVDVEGTYRLDLPQDAAAGAMSFSDPLPARLAPTEIMGGVHLAALEVAPVRYDEATGQVRVLRQLTLRVREQGQTVHYPRGITETVAQCLRPVLPNWGDLALDEHIVRGSMLYIVADNSETGPTIQTLADWRIRKGYPVEIAGPDEIGYPLNTVNVKQYIQERYNSADPPLEFVCLVGDAAGRHTVPPFTYDDPTDPSEDGVGDYDYARLEGNDLLPDVALGRIPFSDLLSLQTVINKTLRYERTPAARTTPNRQNWYKAAAVVGDNDHEAYSVSHIQTMRWIRERMLDSGYPSTSIDTLFWTTYGSDIPASAMNSSLNAGASLWCYRGWNRMNNYDESDVSGLNNVGYWPFMLLLTCNTNTFEYSDLAEAFLSPSPTPNNPKGAIGVVGMSSGATHTRYNNLLISGAVQGLLREGTRTTGGSLLRAKAGFRHNYPFPEDSAIVRLFMGITSLLGDPAVDVYTDTPDTLRIDNPATLPVGSNALTLTVTRPDGTPVDEAYVNLVKGDEVFVGGFTDAGGRITLNFYTTSADTLFITATKHNCLAAMQYTWIEATERHVAPASSLFPLSDDNNGTSHGNFDGLANPGETIELPVLLRNWGSQSVSGVMATLSITDPYIYSVGDNSESYGTIGAGQSASPGDDFDFTVRSYAPNGHVAQFTLTVTDNAAHTWISRIPITLANADAEHVSTTINAGNGTLDPGESGQLWMRLENAGQLALAAGRTAYLRSTEAAVVITDSVGTFAAMPVNGQGTNQADPFGVAAAAWACPGERVPLLCIFPLANGFADTVECTVTLGGVVASSPTPADSYGYWAFDDTDTDYAQRPVYDWVEIDPTQGGAGTVLALRDTVDGGDASIVVDLPFTFRYYGEEFDRITVCSNGWLAMGADQVAHVDFRNYNIPSSMCASGKIAPFWDDLRTEEPSLLSAAELRERNGGRDVLDEGGETCNGAVVIPSLPFIDTGYTCDDGNTCGNLARDLFYRYTVPAGGQHLTLSLCGSLYDSYISVWNPCCENRLVANDNGCGDGYGATITQDFPQGDIWILVEGHGSRCGEYTLTVVGSETREPGHICTYHDEANHRFIVEWSRVFKFNGMDDPTQTFECILYEPGYPETPTGDGEILFQYLECTNTPDVRASNDYCTAGIENLDQTDGVLYSYFNNVHPQVPGAAPLMSGRAVRFTTAMMPPAAPQSPGGLTATAAGGSIRLRWRAVDTDLYGHPLLDVEYRIYRGTQVDFVPDDNSHLATVSDTTFTDPVDAGVRYFYIVQAVSAGDERAAAEPPAAFERKRVAPK